MKKLKAKIISKNEKEVVFRDENGETFYLTPKESQNSYYDTEAYKQTTKKVKKLGENIVNQIFSNKTSSKSSVKSSETKSNDLSNIASHIIKAPPTRCKISCATLTPNMSSIGLLTNPTRPKSTSTAPITIAYVFCTSTIYTTSVVILFL